MVLFVGSCKSGKSTLAYNLCHSQDLDMVVNEPCHKEEFYSSPTYFIAGCHPLHSTIPLHSPKGFYLDKWMNMDNRPKFFVDDGMRFIDTVSYTKLLEAGAHIYLCNITAEVKTWMHGATMNNMCAVTHF